MSPWKQYAVPESGVALQDWFIKSHTRNKSNDSNLTIPQWSRQTTHPNNHFICSLSSTAANCCNTIAESPTLERDPRSSPFPNLRGGSSRLMSHHRHSSRLTSHASLSLVPWVLFHTKTSKTEYGHSGTDVPTTTHKKIRYIFQITGQGLNI